MASVDAVWSINETNQVFTQVMSSETEYPDALILREGLDPDKLGKSFTGNAIRVAYYFRNTDWSNYVKIDDFDKDFRADLGLLELVDFKSVSAGVSRKWYFDDSSWSFFSVSADIKRSDNQAGKTLEDINSIGVSTEGPMQLFVNLTANQRDILFGGIVFEQKFFKLTFSLTPTDSIFVGATLKRGDDIDFTHSAPGTVSLISPYFSWNLNKNLSVIVDYIYETLDVRGGELFSAQVTDMRFKWQFDNRSYIRLVVQSENIKNNTALFVNPIEQEFKTLNTELLYSYKINPQTLFFAGYNSGRVKPDIQFNLKEVEKAVFLKFSYSFMY
jgi:hypothetical protein